MPEVRKRLQVILIRLMGHCPWCQSRFEDSSWLLNRVLLGFAFFALLAWHLFVVCYEESTLRRKFGADYEEHCRAVPR